MTANQEHKKHRRLAGGHRHGLLQREGKVLILLAILMPTLFGIVGLVLDGGLMMDEDRQLQHAADAAATAATADLRLGKDAATASATAVEIIQEGNLLPDATVEVHIPPISGPYAGVAGHVEVIVERSFQSRFMRVLDGIVDHTIQARAVAGLEDATVGAAIVVLDPNPADLAYPTTDEVAAAVDQAAIAEDAAEQLGATELLASVPLVGPIVSNLVGADVDDLMPDIVANLLNDVVNAAPTFAAPTLTAGLEVEGLGQLIVDGAILVNNEWGGVDENGDPAGTAAGPPYGIACMPLLPTTRIVARDIRVVGGVDNQNYYLPFADGDSAPLQANRLPVLDPLRSLPVPSVSSDSDNVVTTIHDPADLVRVAVPLADATTIVNSVYDGLPGLLQPIFQPLMEPLAELLTTPVIEPGVYNSITVLSPVGGARFEPGIYIIRGTNPNTNISLSILGPVEAEGVLFYITDSADYNPTTGLPDAAETSDTTPPNPVASLLPSVVIAPLLAGAHITGLADPASPFNGMLVYQRRNDRRPIILEAQQLIGSGDISGTIYSKWGHTIFAAGAGTYDLRFVTGTMRVVTVTETTIAPADLFPPPQDIFLLE
jgi:hypothetical protein